MATNPNRKSKPVKKNDSMNGAMDFFMGGCIGELFLLIVRREYLEGSVDKMIAWYDHYLGYLIIAGLAVLALGAVLAVLWKASKAKFRIGMTVAVAGAFVAFASFLIRWNMSSLTLLMVAVPVAMLLCIIWCLYDRECALALTVLAVSLIAVWLCRRIAGGTLAVMLKAGVAVWIVLLIVLIFMTKAKKLAKLLPAKADPLPIYVASGLSIVALAAALISSSIAYYAMWALAAVVFALAVYYTVKQL